MSVPSVIADLSQTASSNGPSGSVDPPSVLDDYIRALSSFIAGLRDNNITMPTDTGAANAYVVNPSPAIAAYAAGLEVRFKAVNANTGASTINVNSKGVVNLLNAKGGALLGGQIPANTIIRATCDGSNFRVTSGGQFGGEIPLGSVTVSNAATLDFTGIPSGLVAIEFIVEALCVTGGSAMQVRASNSGTFNTGAQYTYLTMENTIASPGTFVGGGGSGSTSIGLALNVSSNAVLSPLNFTLRFIQRGGVNPGFHGQGWYIDNSNLMHARTLSGVMNIGGEVDGLRLYASAGNITGTIYAWGIGSP